MRYWLPWLTRALVLAASAALAPAFAADVYVPQADVPEPVPVIKEDIIIDLGVGGMVQPKFVGSDQYTVVPYPIIGLTYLRLPLLGEVAGGPERAISIYPSINYVGERDSNDAGYLNGLNDVDASLELGPGLAFRRGPFRAFVDVRYGVTGHNGFVGDLGVDFIAKPTERLTVSLGPRLSLASDEYMQSYFGVTPAESARSGLPAYDPGAGLKDVGIGARATYEMTERVRLYGQATYSHFVADADDSPIIKNGSEDQFTVGIGVSYRFGLDLFR